MNPEKFNTPLVNVDSEGEYILVQKRMKEVNSYIQEQLINKDQEVIQLVQLMFDKSFTLQAQNYLDEQISDLQNNFEELIDSPQANTPEVLLQIEKLKELIKEILDKHEQNDGKLKFTLMQLGALKDVEKSKQEEAEQLVEKIHKQIDTIMYPPFHLN